MKRSRLPTPSLTKITLNRKYLAYNDTDLTIKITLTGSNFNLITSQSDPTVKVKLCGDYSAVTESFDASSQAAGTGTVSSVTADIPVPQTEGGFTAKIFFGSKEQNRIYPAYDNYYGNDITNPTIWVYGSPKFTFFYIPKAGIFGEDKPLTAKVRGTNFKDPGISPADFTVSCTEESSITTGSQVTILSDTELTVDLTIPGQEGSYTVKITSGDQSLEGTFVVKDYSAYTVEKIVLKNGDLVEKDSYNSIEPSNPPVAVIAGVNGYGRAIGIGLHISGEYLAQYADCLNPQCYGAAGKGPTADSCSKTML